MSQTKVHWVEVTPFTHHPSDPKLGVTTPSSFFSVRSHLLHPSDLYILYPPLYLRPYSRDEKLINFDLTSKLERGLQIRTKKKETLVFVSPTREPLNRTVLDQQDDPDPYFRQVQVSKIIKSKIKVKVTSLPVTITKDRYTLQNDVSPFFLNVNVI